MVFHDEIFPMYKDILNITKLRKYYNQNYEILGGTRLTFLFEGPPGCGKSELAKHLAVLFDIKNIYIPKISVGKERIGSFNISMPNGNPKNDRLLIIFDDVDILWSYDREKDNDNIIKLEMFDGLIKFIDSEENKNNIIVFTTNYPDKFDKALFRPGRIDYRIKFGLLPFENCHKFLEKIYKTKINGLAEKSTTAANIISIIRANINNPEGFIDYWNNNDF